MNIYFTLCRIIEDVQDLDAIKKYMDDVIGNSSWTEILCFECFKEVDKAIRFESEDERGCIAFHRVCLECLEECVKMLKEAG